MGEFSYEQLFDIVRRERAREELQDLENTFYGDAQAYTKELEDQVRSHDPLDNQVDIIRTQLVNSRKLLRELYDRREKKILLLALNKARTGSSMINTSSVLAIEQPLFDSLLSALTAQREVVSLAPPVAASKTSFPAATPEVVKTPTPEPVVEKSAGPGEVTVRITAAVPKFLGANGETHGPYAVGAQVALPERLAQILIRKGRAENA